jgi:hypothetical protein
MTAHNSQSIKIWQYVAPIDDSARMKALFSRFKDPDKVRSHFKPGQAGSGCVYDPETSTGRWVATDGRIVVCFAVTSVSHAQADAIADELERQRVFERGAKYELFQSAVERALSISLAQVQ